MRWLDSYLYSGNRGHSATPQKKYHLYGKRLTDPVPGMSNLIKLTSFMYFRKMYETMPIIYYIDFCVNYM